MFIQESVKFDNINATTAPFTLTLGGYYNCNISGATFGTVELQQLAEDNVTWISLKFAFNNAGVEADLVIGSFGANGMKPFILAPGTYRFAIAGATLVYASLTRCPI